MFMHWKIHNQQFEITCFSGNIFMISKACFFQDQLPINSKDPQFFFPSSQICKFFYNFFSFLQSRLESVSSNLLSRIWKTIFFTVLFWSEKILTSNRHKVTDVFFFLWPTQSVDLQRIFFLLIFIVSLSN